MTPTPFAPHLGTTGTARRTARRAVAACVAALLAWALAAPPAAAALPRSQVRGREWWVATLGLEKAWTITKGRGVTVAVVDSGVDASFGDLAGAVEPGFAVGGRTGNGRQDTDDTKHGTRVADFIAGRGTGFGLLGVAPQATILPVALQYGGGGAGPEDATEALTRLAALPDPPDVVNMSFGSPNACTPALQQAVAAAVAKGMVIVASAGNDGANGPTNTPSNCAGVVAVSAYGQDLKVWSGSTRQPYVSLAGPGVSMIGYSTAPSGAGLSSGTSDAAAIVSGGFALLRAKYPTESPRRLVARMLYTARQFQGAQGTRNESWGYGAARPHHALTDTVPASAPNPLFDALDRAAAGSSTPPASPSAPGSSVTSGAGSTTGSSSPAPVATGDDSSSSTGVVVAVVVALVVVLLVVLLLLARSRRRRTPAGPPAGPPSWGGPGGPPGGGP